MTGSKGTVGLIVYGPSGSGKMWAIRHIIKRIGYMIIEPDLVDKNWVTNLTNLMTMHRVNCCATADPQRGCIVIRNADQLNGSGWRGFGAIIAKAMKTTRVPIILTMNQKPYREPYVKYCKMQEVRAPTQAEVIGILRKECPGVVLVDQIAAASNGDLSYALNQAKFGGPCETKDSSMKTTFQTMDELMLCRNGPISLRSGLSKIIGSDRLIPAYIQDNYPRMPSIDLNQTASIADILSEGDTYTRKLQETQNYGGYGALTTLATSVIPCILSRCHPNHAPPTLRGIAGTGDIARASRWTSWKFPEALRNSPAITKRKKLRPLLHAKICGGIPLRGGQSSLEFILHRALCDGILMKTDVMNMFASFEDLENTFYLVGLEKRWKEVPMITRKAIACSYKQWTRKGTAPRKGKRKVKVKVKRKRKKTVQRKKKKFAKKRHTPITKYFKKKCIID